MSWSGFNWFAIAAVGIYIGASLTSLYAGKYPFSGMWAAYAVANVFIVWAEYHQ